MRCRRNATLGGFVALLMIASTYSAVAPLARAATKSTSRTAATLAAAYPQVKADGDSVKFDDGTVMAVDDGKTWPTFDEQLDNADLVDQLSIPYPKGCPVTEPTLNDDPGRLRYDPFFAKIYGSSAKEVGSHLTTVKWFGSTLQVTTINGVDKKLQDIAVELAKHPEWKKFLQKPGGGFNWRPIAKTDRRSVHSYGIAVDMNVGVSDYWLNGGKYRNRIPCGIAEVFEAHGFIWGAKWYHFDTMHFEYRPELLR
jgi:D-alanyl-D-alanine carboxypeptidase